MAERKIETIEYSHKFLKSSKKLPQKIINKAENREVIFKNNAFDPRLRTHKLSGEDKGCWAFGVDDSYRIKFIFLSKREVLFLDIGTHGIYK